MVVNSRLSKLKEMVFTSPFFSLPNMVVQSTSQTILPEGNPLRSFILFQSFGYFPPPDKSVFDVYPPRGIFLH